MGSNHGLSKVDLRKQDSTDWTACDWVECVEGRMGGVPVMVGTRMQVDGILENFDDGLSVEEICYHFFLDEDGVRAILGFAPASG